MLGESCHNKNKDIKRFSHIEFKPINSFLVKRFFMFYLVHVWFSKGLKSPREIVPRKNSAL